MATTSRRYWILGLIGLLLVGLGLTVLNWRSLASNFGQAWEAQAEKTELSLFRLGEVASIQARLRERFGARPDVQYEDVEGVRVLSVSFASAPNRKGTDPTEQARAIGVAAIQATKKSDQIDEVVVSFGRTEFRFTVSELLR